MATLLELLLFLLAATNGVVDVQHVTHVPNYYGTNEDSGARVDCGGQIDGCTIRMSISVYDQEAGEAYLFGAWSPEGRAYAEILAHELAHVWDYMDDGLVNGSPGHRGYAFPDTALGRYCAQNAAERYACAVVETLSLTTVVPETTNVLAQSRARPLFDLRPE